MKRLRWFGMLLMLCSTTACAPTVYGVAYHSHNDPRVVRHMITPIEVTLHADHNYRGTRLSTVRLVIADGQYVAIPVKDRRGRHSTIYAHYKQQNLHLDMDRNCRGIEGSSRFKYDKSWDQGHHYTNIAAGSRYDLTGLRLTVRLASQTEFDSRSPIQRRATYQKDSRSNKISKQENSKSNRNGRHQTIRSKNTGRDSSQQQQVNVQRMQRDEQISKSNIVEKIRQVEIKKERTKGKKVLRSKQMQPDVAWNGKDVHAHREDGSQKYHTRRHRKNE